MKAEDLKIGCVYKLIGREIYYYVKDVVEDCSLVAAEVVQYDFESPDMACVFTTSMLENERVELYKGSIDDLLRERIENLKFVDFNDNEFDYM
jgi:hypothetical protein